MDIDLLTARLLLRAAQHGMPIEEALKLTEFALDYEEDSLDALKDLIRQSFRQQGDGSLHHREEKGKYTEGAPGSERRRGDLPQGCEDDERG